jgi:epsin
MRHRRATLAQVKQMALNLTDLEVKVEEATNNEPWGPHGSVMAGAQSY